MIIHAKLEEQKKMQAQHIVTGCICKNCKHSGQDCDCYGILRCKNINRLVFGTNFCSDFERKSNAT